MVEESASRGLYYRLNVLSIELPAQRERRTDVPVLLDYFVKKHTRGTDRKITIAPKQDFARRLFYRQRPPARIGSSARSCFARTTRSRSTTAARNDPIQRKDRFVRRPLQTTARRHQLRGRRTQPDNAGNGPYRQQHHKIGETASADIQDAAIPGLKNLASKDEASGTDEEDDS